MADITDVLSKLLERTRQGKVSWQPTPDEHMFNAVIGNTIVEILEDPVGDSALRVLNSVGRELETLASWSDVGREWETKLSELYQIARNNALEIDSQLEGLLKELDNEDDLTI